ncbi:MAG: hypothetical protein QOH36_923 [Actinomycetota bacterium]|nr:hypothetical protein [Actinomycetota bacterium]
MDRYRCRPSLARKAETRVDRAVGTIRALATPPSPVPPSALAAALGPRPPDHGVASFVGLEHEYTLTRGGQRVDFRRLIHGLPVPGRRLDPGDANAFRCSSGLVVTCDVEEAEVVSPPVPVAPGFAAAITDWGRWGRDELRRLLPDDVVATGFSTHLSASMPTRLVGAVCALFTRTFAPALMLVLDRPDSHGVFVRPRPGRVELCGEFATGSRLGAAAVLVAGGTRACAAALAPGPDGGRGLPPTLAVAARPATGRPGLFVGRRLAFGFDLYAGGRQASIPLAAGGVIAAQVYVEQAWLAAGLALGDDAAPADLDAGDRMVAGAGPLGIETTGDDGPTPPAPSPRSPFGDLLERRARPEFTVAAIAATWDFTVFRVDDGRRLAYACVPTPWLGSFLGLLDAGRLDAALMDPPTGSVLSTHDQTSVPGLWRDAVIGPDLLPYERTAAAAADLLVAPPLDRPGKLAILAVQPDAVGVADETPTPDRRMVSAVPLAAAAAPTTVAVQLTAADGAPTGPATGPAVAPPSPGPIPDGHRSRAGRILVGALLALILAGTAAALSGVFGGGRSGVEVRTRPSAPTSVATTAPQPATTSLPDTTAAPPPPTSVTSAPSVPVLTTRPTVAVTPIPVPVPVPVPVPTVPEPTLPLTTTATTVPPVPPTDLVAAVFEGPAGCAFQPPSATLAVGSTVSFRNDTDTDVTIVVGDTTISLESGGTSAPVPLAVPGTIQVTCTMAGGDPGGMTLTVTAG